MQNRQVMRKYLPRKKLSNIIFLAATLLFLPGIKQESNAASIITGHPRDVQECEYYTGDVVFSCTAQKGSSFQWQEYVPDGKTWIWKDMSDDPSGKIIISGATTNTLTITFTKDHKLGTTDQRSFRCKVTYLRTTEYTNSALLYVVVSPDVTNQPDATTKNVGETATFSVSVSGDSPSYRWYRYYGGLWTAISGATGTSYITPALTMDDDGAYYRCKASNSCGYEYSRSALLTVKRPVSVTDQPDDVTKCPGKGITVSFSVTVSPSTDIGYQWQLNTGSGWSDILNATSSTYSRYFNPLTTSYNGYAYRCHIINNLGDDVISNTAYLYVNSPPSGSTQPVSAEKRTGESVSFSYTATGTAPISYQWKKWNGSSWANISGATGTTYSISSIALADSGYYRCMATNTCGSAYSNTATLTVYEPLSITTQPANVTECEGFIGDVMYAVEGLPSSGKTYQWQVMEPAGSFVNIPEGSGGKEDTLVIPFDPLTIDYNGYAYRCILYDPFGDSLVSNSAYLYVDEVPAVTSHPSSATKDVEESVTFSVSATGTPPLAYQWQENGGSGWTGISGETGTSLTIVSVDLIDAGDYRCLVGNACDTAESNAATLTVNQPAYDDGWFAQTSGTSKNLRNVQFISELEGWAVSDDPDLLLHTEDGGGTWSSVYTEDAGNNGLMDPYSYCGIYFTDAQHGFVGTHNGYAYTVDGGVTWAEKNIATEIGLGGDFNTSSVYFVNADTGWLAGDDGLIAITRDGGATWEKQNWKYDEDRVTDANLSCIYYVNDTTGWIGGAGGVIISTTDAGETWTLQSTPDDYTVRDIDFVNADTGFAVSTYENGNSYRSLLKTENGGDTWTKIDDYSMPDMSYYSIDFVDALNGWIAGHYSSDGKIIKTSDGGYTWYEQSVENPNRLFDINMIDANNGWAVGSSGSIQRTATGGCLNPTVNLREDKEFCAGDVYELVADTFAQNVNCTYDWGSGPASGRLTVTESGICHVEVTNLCGVSAYDTVEITFNPLPDARAGEDTAICEGGSVQLMASGGGLYRWYDTPYLDDLEIQNPIATPPLGVTQFIVEVTGSRGCANTDTVEVTVNPIPDSKYSIQDYVCGADTVNVFYTGDYRNGNFTWDFDGAEIIEGSGAGPYKVRWGVHGLKEVSLRVEQDGCTSKDSTRYISVDPVPQSDFSIPDSVCGNAPVFISYNGIDSLGATFSWDFDGGDTISGAGSGPYEISWNDPGQKVVSLQVIQGNCMSHSTDTISVFAVPTADFTIPSTVCGSGDVMVRYTGNASDNATYTWDLGDAAGTPAVDSFRVSWDTAGVRYLKFVVEENGCRSDTNTREISVNPIPESSFLMKKRVCGDDQVQISYIGNASNTAAYDWSLDGGTILDGDTAANPQGPFYVAWATGETKKVTLQVTENNCVAERDTNLITVAYPYEDETICLITIDLATGKNMVVWEKTEDPGIDSYNIYRESNVTDVYTLIGNVDADSLSIFVDMGSEPRNKQHLYKISVVDTCGRESAKSPYHKTLLLQYVSSVEGVNMNWGEYKVENGDMKFNSYIIYRGSDTASLSPVDTVSGSSNRFTDTEPDALAGKRWYRIAGVKPTPCVLTVNDGKKADSGPFSHSLSNLEDNRLQSTGVEQLTENPDGFAVFPNPFRHNTNLVYTLERPAFVRMEIFNILGARISQLANEVQQPGEYHYTLSADELPVTSGLWYVKLTIGDQIYTRKLILTK